MGGLAQEQFEEFFLDGGLEAADEGSGKGTQGTGKVVAFEDEVAGAVDGAEEGDGFAVEESGVADEGDGGAVGGVGAVAEGRGGAGRAGVIACDLHVLKSEVEVRWLCSRGFEGGEDRVGRAFRKIEHLDAHHLDGFIEIEDDVRGDIFGLEYGGVVKAQIEGVGFYCRGQFRLQCVPWNLSNCPQTT